MFLVEQAHWYYEDFVRVEQPNLKTLRLRDFTDDVPQGEGARAQQGANG